jgi:hypothetical protein
LQLGFTQRQPTFADAAGTKAKTHTLLHGSLTLISYLSKGDLAAAIFQPATNM